MKPVIAIPSYKRPQATAIKRLKDVPLDKYLFIRPEDYDSYKPIAEENGFKIIKLKNVTNIGNTRQKLVEYCHSKGFEWVFMFDDDIQKVECLAQTKDKITSARILYEPDKKPRFEMRALKSWFKTAKEHNLSLSSPNHRAYDRFNHGYLRVNKSACIQCVLLHIPDIILVGNYKSLREVGNEDYYIQFKLMNAGKFCGKVGSIEYDCPSVGQGSGGNNADEYTDINERYKLYVHTFLDNVCDDPTKITTKITKTGQKSVQFVWKSFGGYEEKLQLLQKEE